MSRLDRMILKSVLSNPQDWTIDGPGDRFLRNGNVELCKRMDGTWCMTTSIDQVQLGWFANRVLDTSRAASRFMRTPKDRP